jgi:hypothetical protein
MIVCDLVICFESLKKVEFEKLKQLLCVRFYKLQQTLLYIL